MRLILCLTVAISSLVDVRVVIKVVKTLAFELRLRMCMGLMVGANSLVVRLVMGVGARNRLYRRRCLGERVVVVLPWTRMTDPSTLIRST